MADVTNGRVTTVGELRRALMPFDDETEIVVSFSTEIDDDDIHVTGGLVAIALESPCDPDEPNFLRLTASDMDEALSTDESDRG